jgi:hypothetical protein
MHMQNEVECVFNSKIVRTAWQICYILKPIPILKTCKHGFQVVKIIKFLN